MKKQEVIAVGLSGGVDSAVAAAVLVQQGYTVVGVTMQVWDHSLPVKDEGRCGCYGPGEPRHIQTARAIAQHLGIPHTVIPLADEYRREVVDYFRSEYRCGRTPNPCARCNRRIKFDALWRRIQEAGISFTRFATGHYARVRQDPTGERVELLRGVDPHKDQSYFLAGLSQEQLRHVIFPLGEKTKSGVRALARSFGLEELTSLQESQDFFEGRDYSVLFGREDARPGVIVDVDGRERGRHRGIIYYTVGQRRGLRLGGGTGTPLYVVRIDAASNTLVVGPREKLLSRALRASAIHWIGGPPPDGPRRLTARIRQQHRDAPAWLLPEGQPDVGRVEFDTPQFAVTPGQIVVFYQEDRVLGCGTIERAFEGATNL